MGLADEFGAVLAALRRERGYSQDTLARMAGLSRTTPSLLETGKREPRLATIVALADALGIDPSMLVAGLRPERPPRRPAP
jgi:transcriptional regulator with XRE-family HTH domain